MKSSGFGFKLALGAVLCAFGAAAIAPAGAWGAATTVRAATTLTGAAFGEAKATCPPGTSVANGGFDADFGFGPGDPRVTITELRRTSLRDWYLQAFNNGLGSGQLEAIAYCKPGRLRYGELNRNVSIEPGALGETSLRCPRGRRLAMSGFEGGLTGLAPTSFISITGLYPSGPPRPSYPVKRGPLIGTAANTGPGPDSGTLTLYAYCAQRDSGRIFTERSKDVTIGAPSMPYSVGVTQGCKPREQLAFGGFGFFGVDVTLPIPVLYEMQRSGARGWRTSVAETGGIGSAAMFMESRPTCGRRLRRAH